MFLGVQQQLRLAVHAAYDVGQADHLLVAQQQVLGKIVRLLHLQHQGEGRQLDRRQRLVGRELLAHGDKLHPFEATFAAARWISAGRHVQQYLDLRMPG